MFLGDVSGSQRRENEVLALRTQHLAGIVNKALRLVQDHPAGNAHLVPDEGLIADIREQPREGTVPM